MPSASMDAENTNRARRMARALCVATSLSLATALTLGCSDDVAPPEGRGGGSADTDTGADTGTGTGTGLNTATSVDTWTATETSTGSSTSTGTAHACWDLPDEQACVDCCVAEHEEELGQLHGYLVQLCVCQTAVNPICYAACEDWCGNQGQPPDTNCAVCMESVFASYAGCVSKAEDLCLEDPGCAPIVECQGGC